MTVSTQPDVRMRRRYVVAAAVALSIAALHGRWTRLAQVFAVLAGVTYAVFLFAVFLWP